MKIRSELQSRYRTLSSPVKASLWFVACNVLQNGISLISTPIFTRLLTTAQYGVYSVYQSWYSIIAIFATLNLYCGVFNNGLTKFSDDKKAWTSSMQGLSSLATIILFGVYMVDTSFWNRILQLDTLFVVLIFVQLFFVPAYQLWAVGQRYEYKYRSLVAVTLLIAIASPAVGIVAVLSTDHKAEARVLSYVLVQIAVGLVIYIINLKNGKRFFKKQYWKYALSFNLPLIPHYLSQIVLQQSDRIMINNMVGTGEAAIYSVAYTLSTLMIIVTNAINGSFVPYTYQNMKAKTYQNIRDTSIILIIVVGVCCMGVALVGPDLIAVLAAESYADAIWIIPPVSASVYFMFLYNLFGNEEFYFESTKFTMVASVLAAALNVGLNYIFIRSYGYIAAGYTTLACYILYASAHGMLCYHLSKKRGIVQELWNFKLVIAFSFVLIVLSVAVNILYVFNWVRYGLIAMMVIVILVQKKKMLLLAHRIYSMKKIKITGN